MQGSMSTGDQLWDDLAVQWSSSTKRANPNLVLRIWTALETSTDPFSIASLAKLDSLQVVEKLLWPTFSSDAPNQHVLLLATLLNYKKEARQLIWSNLTGFAEQYHVLFRRILSLSLDFTSHIASRNIVLSFVANAFQSLEQDPIRKECAPLVSIGIWENLHTQESLEEQLSVSPNRRKAWRSAKKRFDSADQETQQQLRLDRVWLYNIVLDFAKRINANVFAKAESVYCSRFLAFLIDLISQLPTRRYSIVLLRDLNLIPLLRTSAIYEAREDVVFRDFVRLYEHFSTFQIDDAGEVAVTRDTFHRQSLLKLQKIALQHFEQKLKVLALSNIASIGNPVELRSLLESLSDDELQQLCSLSSLRTSYPASTGIATERSFLLEVLLSNYVVPKNLHETMEELSILPTEASLYNPALLRNETYNGAEPLALPKLNLQYLTLTDFLWRSFRLHQSEAFYEIRKDMESIVRKLKPQASRDSSNTRFTGFSKMAIPIDKPAIIDVLPPAVGETAPAQIRAEVVLDVGRLGGQVRAEWDSLKPKDTVFLLSVKAPTTDSRSLTNGNSQERPESHGISLIRSAEVISVQDDKGKPIKSRGTESTARGNTRRLLLNLDADAFQKDKAKLNLEKVDVYKSINLIVRRAGRENNFKPLLDSVRDLSKLGAKLPNWLQDVYLGFGHPSSATYPQIDQKLSQIDFRDTFLDWDHATSSFPGAKVQYDGNHAPEPPYKLHFPPAPAEQNAALANPKKRRREQMEIDHEDEKTLKISSYPPPVTGPYPVDRPKQNQIRFTGKQVNALVTSSQPGLSLIVGPPGTGKTDVAAQLINLLYHNFPQERILLVAHSNQALNQLFSKIAALDIDRRHLLRLGHGEEELEIEGSYGKSGRVESFLENRGGLLSEVARLAASLAIEGAHGSSCETADYFNQVFVQPAWTRFWDATKSSGSTADTIAQAFPFKKFFRNAPVPELFPSTASAEQCMEIAKGCEYHMSKIFTELESIRPFEILRSPRDQANYLLVREARIIAMTSTHAAIRRQEIASLGFHYDTLIMEEAAQITEIESFIPCAMQNLDPKTGELPLKRIVLVGDHLQNSPVVQNFALRDYANLDQSLFLRLIRLGVPHIMLDAQGRCRPSLTNLFSWRYLGLQNLPHITSQPEFQRANAGFRHEFQFINIDDYQGAGEREPTSHFIQNLGEAEYAVALYQYMRLLGYPAKSISILAAYAGQRALIRDVLEHRCKANKLFGLPKTVTTIDKYQGEQNDYVILSLTRTKTVGYLRDVRRLTVALSRARLGLYILGRRSLFQDLPGLDVAMRPGNADGHLEIVTGEMFPSQRLIDVVEVPGTTEIHGLEHLGQYVYEMTQAKVKSLGGNVALAANGDGENGLEDEELAEEADVDAEIDPLHENV